MIRTLRIRRVTASMLLLAASAACAAERPVIPPDEFVFCTVCHGVQLKGNPVIQAPRLSGMPEWYVTRQLAAFKSGWRGTHEEDFLGMEMLPMAAILTDMEIDDAAGYVQAVESDLPPVTVAGNAADGEVLYRSCAACHGNDGGGIEALGGPPLAGQNDWYLYRQLLNFRNGVRGSHAGDTWGAQMRAAAQVFADDEAIRNVVAYINGLQNR